MMIQVMSASALYPPLYNGRSELGRDAVQVVLFNEAMPTVWRQVEGYLEKNATIGNAEVRTLLKTDSALKASKQLSQWVMAGLLVVDNPSAAKQHRRYRRPSESIDVLFQSLKKTSDPNE